MRQTQLFCLVPVLAGLLLLGTVRAADDDKDFTPLFNGKDLTGLKLVSSSKDPAVKIEEAFKVKDGVIECSGKPFGYVGTEKSYKNYHLKFELRYVRPKDLTDDSKFGGNSGVLIHIRDAKTPWPTCIEAQGMNRDMGNLFGLGVKGEFKKDADAQKKAIKPIGEWNLYEVLSKDGELTVKLNGTQVASGKGELTEGPIGWQSEGAEIHFKNLKIKELK